MSCDWSQAWDTTWWHFWNRFETNLQLIDAFYWHRRTFQMYFQNLVKSMTRDSASWVVNIFLHRCLPKSLFPDKLPSCFSQTAFLASLYFVKIALSSGNDSLGRSVSSALLYLFNFLNQLIVVLATTDNFWSTEFVFLFTGDQMGLWLIIAAGGGCLLPYNWDREETRDSLSETMAAEQKSFDDPGAGLALLWDQERSGRASST